MYKYKRFRKVHKKVMYEFSAVWPLKLGTSWTLVFIYISFLIIFFASSILRSLWEASKGGRRAQKKSATETGWMVPQAGAIWTDELGEGTVSFFESRVGTRKRDRISGSRRDRCEGVPPRWGSPTTSRPALRRSRNCGRKMMATGWYSSVS